MGKTKVKKSKKKEKPIHYDDCSCNRPVELAISHCVRCGDTAEYYTDYKAYCYDHMIEYVLEQYVEENTEEVEVCSECQIEKEECSCDPICTECGEEEASCECGTCSSCGCESCESEEDCCLSGFECECGCNDEE